MTLSMTKTDAVAKLIEEDILTGALSQGARLLQQELAVRYGVSTTPVREAMRKLEASGLLRHDPNRGHIVSTKTADEADDILAARQLIEGLLAEFAARRLSDADLKRLRELAANMHRDVNRAASHMHLSTEFHNTIYLAAGRPTLFEISRQLSDQISVLVNVSASGHLNELDEDHDAILAACEKRDSKALGAAVRRHVGALRTRVVAYLRDLETQAVN